MVCESKEYQETGQGNYHGLLPSTLVPILLASPAGFKENGNTQMAFTINEFVAV